MAIHKVIEVLSQSTRAGKNMEGVVHDNRIVQDRVNANITFEVES